MNRLTTIISHFKKSVFPAMPSDPGAAKEEGRVLSSRHLDFSDAPDIRNEHILLLGSASRPVRFDFALRGS
jgi:hypothetical protein